jgi:hypothetical protein
MIQASLIIQHLRRRWSQGRRLRLPDLAAAASPRLGLNADPQVQRLLKELTAGFSLDSPLRQEIAAEMLGHLEDSLDAKLADGLPREAALAAALQEFGPAAAVADGLREANRIRWLADLVFLFVLTPLTAMLCAILVALVSLGTMTLCHFEAVVAVTLPLGLQLTLSWILVVAAWVGCSCGGWMIQRRPFVTEIGTCFGICTAVPLVQGMFMGKPWLLPLAIPLACIAYDLGMMLATDWRLAGLGGRLQSALAGAIAMGTLWMLACAAFVLPLSTHGQRHLLDAALIGLLYGGLWGWLESQDKCPKALDAET